MFDPSAPFIKVYGTDGDQWGKKLFYAVDGVLLIGESGSETGENLFIAKTDFNGNEFWAVDVFSELEQVDTITVNSYLSGGVTEQGGNLVLGATLDLTIEDQFNNTFIDKTVIMLKKVDFNGNPVDEQIIGMDLESSTVTDVITNSRGEVVVTGQSFNPDQSARDGDSPGFTTWLTLANTIIPQPEWNGFYQSQYQTIGVQTIEVVPSSGPPRLFCLVNSAEDANQTSFDVDIRVPNYDSYGVLEDATIDFARLPGVDERGFNITNVAYPNFAVSYQVADSAYIQIVSAAGVSINKIGIATGGRIMLSGTAVLGSDLIIFGKIQITDGNDDIYIARISNNGVVWEKTIGNLNVDSGGGSVLVLPDNSILMIGTVELGVQKKMALIKMSEDGDLNSN